MIPPHGATKEGSHQYFVRPSSVHADKKRSLGDLLVSSLACGTYLGGYDDETDRLYEAALQKALTSGCNFIDTAINYRCQRSERNIGKVLKTLFAKGKYNRSQFVVATKGGFIPFDGTPPANMKDWIRTQWIETGVVTERDIVSSCHCLHPAYLQKQIDQSLANLGLSTIDIYYLHNPETQLPVVGADELFKRLQKAFEKLEENVSLGKIQYYGLATWTAFREAAGQDDALALEKIIELAREAGGKDHHFRAIQLPYNLAMLEAVSVHNQSFQGKTYPIIPVASYEGVSVMVSAPLLQGQLVSLSSSVLSRFPGSLTPAQKAIQFVMSTPGVVSALVGMKQMAHVEENLGVLQMPSWDLATLEKIGEGLVGR